MPELSRYAGYNVLDKWDSMSFDDLTRVVLRRRLQSPPERRFFGPEEFRLLEAACARLLCTEPGDPPIANWIDADLFEGRGEGFRHPDMPPHDVAWHKGLRGLQAEARRRFLRPFDELNGDEQDLTLRAVQNDDVDLPSFDGISPSRFFTHLLLKSAAAHFYSRPEAWSEIGFGGPASPRGYVRLGLDKRDPWEAEIRP
jgi:hypothetical protein